MAAALFVVGFALVGWGGYALVMGGWLPEGERRWMLWSASLVAGAAAYAAALRLRRDA